MSYIEKIYKKTYWILTNKNLSVMFLLKKSEDGDFEFLLETK